MPILYKDVQNLKGNRRGHRKETGYLAQNVRKIAALDDKPTKDTHKIHLFRGKCR